MWSVFHSLKDFWLLEHLDHTQVGNMRRQHKHVSVVSSVLIVMFRNEVLNTVWNGKRLFRTVR
jgi:hypothetical protein